MRIYWRALKSFISCTILTSHFPAVFYLLFTPCWQIMYFGQLSCPIFYSSKRQRHHSVVQQSKCIYYIHSSPLLSALHSRGLIIQLNMKVQSHFTTQQDDKTEYQRFTQSNGLSPISTIILLSWLCIQQIALYPEIIITLQSSRLSCYLNEKCGRFLQTGYLIANVIRAGRAYPQPAN